ncbi:hypothetical protein Dsin_030872 [Dipteronia sinensis]|uniref:CVC domain-containing protein n=1 Tax=Dipteronia sinensis TaxID=43782 RepID=A0AAE0DRJ1_9ROSI|nr:hypothetical protein Dsin_030872 [Dipteronia sinensis]
MGFSAPNHLLYAYDFLIFCRGTVWNLKNIMGAFEVYGNISGQLVNWGKSSIYFGSSVSQSLIDCSPWLVCRLVSCLSFTWGSQLFRGKPKKSVLQPITDEILSKFAKWKGKALSLAGRATLIKSVITGSFVHSFMIYKWHSSLLRLVNRKLRNFLWTGIPDYLGSLLRVRVFDFIHEGMWVLDISFRARFPDLCFRIDRIAIYPVTDSLVWAHSRDGQVSYKSAYSCMLYDSPHVSWWRGVWCHFIPPSRSALT